MSLTLTREVRICCWYTKASAIYWRNHFPKCNGVQVMFWKRWMLSFQLIPFVVYSKEWRTSDRGRAYCVQLLRTGQLAECSHDPPCRYWSVYLLLFIKNTEHAKLLRRYVFSSESEQEERKRASSGDQILYGCCASCIQSMFLWISFPPAHVSIDINRQVQTVGTKIWIWSAPSCLQGRFW